MKWISVIEKKRVFEVQHWEDYLKLTEQIGKRYASHQQGGYSTRVLILYRGLHDSELPLDTTLERYCSSVWTVNDYYELIKRIIPVVKRYSCIDWKLSSVMPSWQPKNRLPCYEYWSYLRHCGFPSPLLDWTIDPRIAAFFAFDKPEVEQDKTNGKVAIFVHIGMPNQAYSFWDGAPVISPQKDITKIPVRDVVQKACQTICTEEINGIQTIISHERIFKNRPLEVLDQDFLCKVTIPKSERIKAISYLMKHGITHSHLYQTGNLLTQTIDFKWSGETYNQL